MGREEKNRPDEFLSLLCGNYSCAFLRNLGQMQKGGCFLKRNVLRKLRVLVAHVAWQEGVRVGGWATGYGIC